MDNREGSPCDGLIEYLTGESSDMERKRFEKHLTACSACQGEARVWREVLDSLADDVELLELPADLKDEVIGPLIDKENRSKGPIKKSLPSLFRSRYARGCAGIALTMMAFLSGWLMRDAWVDSALQETTAQSPSSIETLFQLSAERDNGKFDDSPRAYGVACLVRSGGSEQLVVYVFGSPRTREDEAYQVWLWKDGTRTSAGTFTVGDSGIGIMTLPLSQGLPVIDSVGVTLEPDSHSSSPRGPKMFGSIKSTSPQEA